MLDVFIIGAGPIGLACGIAAIKAELSYKIVDKGCLVNSLYHYPTNMTFFSTAEKLEIGEVPFVCNKPKPGRDEALEYYRRVALHYKLDLHLFEQVQQIDTENDVYTIRTDKNIYQAKNIIIATGFYDRPVLLNIKGEELPKLAHYYDDPHYYSFSKVIVIGSQNSAIDAALECWRKGAEVTMVIRQPEIGQRVKYWVKPDIENRIKEGSIKAYFSSSLVEIREKEADIQTPEGLITIPNDFVLAMTGYKPDLRFLEQTGIQLSADEKLLPFYNPETMETNRKGIYLAGVICGGMDTHSWFIENSRIHAQLIAESIKLNA
ncbi:YpdA family putative bacillithiol disulfide reductase [Taibaiella soli]|uniref:YpdA family putative bacillithiol disulfide reductase n=1 Tax=Taibaiella soli TaxID=1649169 RepID=A0A2W2A7U9_9BACT|nr:YpdA family putative bacillithiol disulfide reductase [Taibaiella soli]PZF71331.1 YpdA family putative bacillithiol disulfide reductase [Taibaiella soli]